MTYDFHGESPPGIGLWGEGSAGRLALPVSQRRGLQAAGMTKAARPVADGFIEELKAAITATLKNKKASAKDKNQAIANGIKLAMIQHKISPEEEDSYFGK